MNAARPRVLFAALAALAFHPAAFGQQLREISLAGEKAVLTAPLIEAGGPRHANVTIVEYFDYNCPYCRRVGPTLRQIIAEDDKVALVYKDWPVLGDVSTYAARCALAARWQDKYLPAHDALLTGPRLAADGQVEDALQKAGIDMARLKRDLAAHSHDIDAMLARNAAEAHALELDGTPGILVGRVLMPGGAELRFFQNLIAQVRAAKP